jgi:hypothetical protein
MNIPKHYGPMSLGVLVKVRSGKAGQRKSENIHSVLPTKQLIDDDKLTDQFIYLK